MSEVVEHSQQARYTYEDYLSWPEGERWELIEGIPFNMTPAPSTEHQRLVLEIAMALNSGFRKSGCSVFVSPFDVRLPVHNDHGDEIISVVQPDIVVVCDPSKIDKKGCKGAPDLVIEITSPSTFRKDLINKYLLYEKSGVNDYWIVYPDNKAISVYKLVDGNYRLPDIFTINDTIILDATTDLSIPLNTLFIAE